MIDTITAVLKLADRPMRARDIHTAAEELLGRPIKWTSVKATLAGHACGPQPRFQRTLTGRKSSSASVLPFTTTGSSAS